MRYQIGDLLFYAEDNTAGLITQIEDGNYTILWTKTKWGENYKTFMGIGEIEYWIGNEGMKHIPASK
mgnify:CR=1 FL=1|jgi:hypothetical protein